jgi:hypothetical protein
MQCRMNWKSKTPCSTYTHPFYGICIGRLPSCERRTNFSVTLSWNTSELLSARSYRHALAVYEAHYRVRCHESEVCHEGRADHEPEAHSSARPKVRKHIAKTPSAVIGSDTQARSISVR